MTIGEALNIILFWFAYSVKGRIVMEHLSHVQLWELDGHQVRNEHFEFKTV